MLAKGDELWPQLRDLIKLVDRITSSWHGTDYEAFIWTNLAAFSKQKKWKRIAERLDKPEFRRTLREQGSDQGGGGSEAPTPPSLSPQLELDFDGV